VSAALQVSVESAPNVARLRGFVQRFAALLEATRDEVVLLAEGASLLTELVTHDDWLPEVYAEAHPQRYQQYLLHCDSSERFSVVSFVWGPGQETPIHDHRVWGLVGVLRGAELNQSYTRAAAGQLREDGKPQRLEVGDVAALSPSGTDIHRVRNAFADRTSVSIHLYGANIGAVSRATYDERGQSKPFISGYANSHLPNLWDKSKSS